ncbi:MAG: acyl-CoA dehydrogenase [Candidatus Binatia bacterium]|nr:MAG: acyl-CoA dehydrogenase [Candidatus Binatia bacterium]
MDFAFTEEHEELRQTVRRFLENKSPEAAVRRWMETERGYDEDVWLEMAGQMGLQGLIVPEAQGGAGLGPVELAIVMEEMGRVLFCAPYLSSAVLAARALLEAASEEAKAELLPRIASGEIVATLAFTEKQALWDPELVRTEAVRRGDSWSIDGVKDYVLDGHVAHVLLVVARTDDGLGLFRVEGEAEGLRRTLLPTLDLTRKLARCQFSKTPAVRIDRDGDLAKALERTVAHTLVALSAEQVGGAQRCLEMSTDYAKTRIQFGRPIGSFQAIKHKCADMLVEVEFARSAAYHAAFRAAEGDENELLTASAMAKSYCSEAYFRAAAETIQIHGGMGFTWEHPAHLYFKRAKSSALLFGDPVFHREKLADRLGI